MGRILIQPTLSTLEEYLPFTDKHGFGFEVVDFAIPERGAGDYEAAIRHYQSHVPREKLISKHAAFKDLYINSPDPLIRGVSERRYDTNLQIADQLGLEYVVFHSNILPVIRHEAYRQNWVKTQAEFWSSKLSEHPFTVLLENMWDPDPSALSALIAAVGVENLGVCFDTGHCNIFSSVPMREWFERLGTHIGYIHLNDNLGDVDNELPAGEGSVDWIEFNQLVQDCCDEPLVVLELSDLKRVAKTINYLQENKIFPYY